MSESTCKGCGKPIFWAKDRLGKNIPLDPRATVYELTKDFTGAKIAQIHTANEVMVSHFNTCSKANDFSGSKRS